MDVHVGGLGRSRMPIVAIGAALLFVSGTTAVAGWLDPTAARVARREAIVAEVDAVRAVELARAEYLACGDEARAVAAVAARSAVLAGACWAELGVSAQSDRAMWIVRAVDDFAVHAIADLDEDGELQEIVATKDRAAELWTPERVH